MDIGSAYGKIVIDASGVEAAVNQAKRTLAQGFADMGQSISNLGGMLTGLSAPLAAFGGFGLKAASDFDSLFTQISARTGIVGDELEGLKDMALQWGASTVFSAQQAGDAFLQLLTSGMKASDAIGVMPTVLNAAAAGNMELGRAADMVTNVMASMNLEVGEAEALVDAVSRAAASSPASMDELLEAMAGVGGMAAGAGMDFRDLSGLLAIFANAGIRGSEAGTQLRSMLVAMNQDTEKAQGAWAALGTSLYDSEGNARRFADVLEEMRGGLAQMDDQTRNSTIKTLAGAYGLMGFNAILASDGIDAMLETMNEQASAGDVAAAMMDTFKMSVDSLMGSLQALAIKALTPMMNDVLKPMIQRLIEVVNGVTAWVTANPELTSQIVKIASAFVALGPALMGVGQGMRLVGLLMGALTSPIGMVVAAITGLKLAFDTNFLGIRDAVQPIIDFLGQAFAQVAGSISTFVQTLQGGSSLGDAIGAAFGPDALGAMQGLVAIVTETVMPALQSFVDWLGGIWSMVGPALEQLGAWFLQDVLPQVGAIITERVMPVLQSLGEFLVNIWTLVAPALTQLAAWFLQDGLPAIQNVISNVVLPVIDGFFAVIAGIWEFVRPGLEQFAAWFIQDALPGVINFLQTTVQPFLEAFFGFVAGVWDLVSPALEALFGWFAESGLPIIQGEIERVWNVVLKPFIETLAGIWSAVSAGVTYLFNWFTINGLPAIRQSIEFFMNNIVRPLINLLSGIWNAVRGGIEAFRNGIMQFLQPIIDLIEGLLGKFREVQNAVNAGATGRDYAGGEIAAMQAGGKQITRQQLEAQMWQSTLAQVGGNDLAARMLYPTVMAEATKDPTMAAILRGRAAGGPVQRNVPYIVGERGPEMFVPEGSGRIVPNHAMGSGVQIGNMTIHANSEAEGRAAALGFQRQLEEVMRANG